MKLKQEKASNVIQLPNSISDKQLFDAQQTINFLKEQKTEFCDEVLEFAMDQTFNAIKNFGFMHDGRRVNTKDIVMLEQSIGSILYRYYGLEHPLHSVVEDMISIPSEDDIDDDDIEFEDGDEFQPEQLEFEFEEQ